MRRMTLAEACSWPLIILFLYAAGSKLGDFSTFFTQLEKSPFINGFTGLVAFVVPLAEIVVAVGFLFTRTRLPAMYGALFLMTLFAAYIYAMLRFSYYIPCSCGGVLSAMSWPQHFIFNLVFLGLSMVGVIAEEARHRPNLTLLHP